MTDRSTDTDGSIATWAWDFGDGNAATTQNPSHAYSTEGNYEVRLTVTDDQGLTATATNSVMVTEEVDLTGLYNGTLTHDGNTREYARYVPASYTGDTKMPLVVYLHGAPENKEAAQATTDFIAVADAEDFIVVFAEAGFSSGNGFIWADGRGSGADAAFDDVSFVNALVDVLVSEVEINTAKIYVCGFSNGGSAVQRIAIESNAKFAAMATVSSGLHVKYETENPGRAIPMLFIHGTTDQLAPYAGGISPFVANLFTESLLGVDQSVSFWVTNNACNATPSENTLPDTDANDASTVTTLTYTGGSNGAEVKLYRITGGGHTWPGVAGRPAMPFGTTNNDIKAGQEIWDFFNQFELP